MRSPSITRQASLARGIPIALLTKGTVRDARGLASMTYNRPALIAYWTLSRPTTRSPRAMPRVCSRMRSSISPPNEWGQHAGRVARVDAGLLDVLHDPPTQTSSPSHRASTSTSIAFSRKRSR